MWDGYCADASTGENNTAYFNLLLSSEATQGKASAVEDKRLPNHWAKDFWLKGLVVK